MHNSRQTRWALCGAAAAALAFGSCTLRGRQHHATLADDWPYRYSRVSAASVAGPMQAQAARGAVLEHTLWNEQFVEGSALLQPSAAARLDSLVHRNTSGQLNIYLQTAHDIGFVPGRPQEYVQQRTKLDAERAASITEYLSALKPELYCAVYVHDPMPPSMAGDEAGLAVAAMYQSPAAVLVVPPTYLGATGSLLEVVTGEGGGEPLPSPVIHGDAGGLPEAGPPPGGE